MRFGGVPSVKGMELRHTDRYNNAAVTDQLYLLLEEHRVMNIITDTAGRLDLLHMRLTTPSTFVRYVGANDAKSDRSRLDEWGGTPEGLGGSRDRGHPLLRTPEPQTGIAVACSRVHPRTGPGTGHEAEGATYAGRRAVRGISTSLWSLTPEVKTLKAWLRIDAVYTVPIPSMLPGP